VIYPGCGRPGRWSARSGWCRMPQSRSMLMLADNRGRGSCAATAGGSRRRGSTRSRGQGCGCSTP
jgi:hypothetical protein